MLPRTSWPILVTIAGTGYSSGDVHAGVNKLAGVEPGVSVGALIRSMGDAQRVKPSGAIDLIMRAGLVSARTLDQEDVLAQFALQGRSRHRRRARHRQRCTYPVHRLGHTGERPPRAASRRPWPRSSPPANIEIKTIDRVIARQAIADKFDVDDLLDGVWDPDENRFEWSGTLAAGESATVRNARHLADRGRRHGFRTASALAGDFVLNVPSTNTADIQAAANLVLARRRNPIELMTLDIPLGTAMPRILPGDAVRVALALQESLDVYQPLADDLWIIHGIDLTQPAPAQATVKLMLSRRLPRLSRT